MGFGALGKASVLLGKIEKEGGMKKKGNRKGRRKLVGGGYGVVGG